MIDKKNQDIEKELEEDFGEASGGILNGENILFEPELTQETPQVAELLKELEESRERANDCYDKYMRSEAERQTQQKRARIELEKAHKFAVEKFTKELLGVVDSLEQGLSASEQPETGPLLEGMELTLKLFLDTLAKFGVSQVNPQGQIFDPKLHEAMSMVDDPNAMPNAVITVFQKGYLLNERLIRPARVVVAKGGSDKPKTSQVDEKV